MLASVTITVLYFIPVLYICYQAFLVAHQKYYGEDGTEEDDIWRECKQMIDWFLMMVERSDLGGWGLAISSLIHM